MYEWAIIAAAAAVIAAGAAGFRLGSDHEIAARAREKEHITQAVDAANAASAKAIAQLKPKYTTIQNQLEKQIETHTVYRDCRLDAVGLQLVNQALSHANAAAPGDGKLPRVDPPAK